MTDTEIYQEIVRIREAGEEAALVTIVSTSGSTPREEGAKMLVRADGSILGSIGGGGMEARVCELAAEVMRKGKPNRFQLSLTEGEGEGMGMICGGDMDIFIEPVLSAPTLYLFGGGHMSLPIAKIGKLLNFRVVVVDDREEFANPERFPEADIVIAEDFDKVFPKLKIKETGAIVVVTREHQYDELVLERALGTPAGYIGMLGSKTKNKAVFAKLRAKGIPQEQLDRVHAPIGLGINAETPEEIAVSILAEIIQVRRARPGTDAKGTSPPGGGH
jgi:xanthine dehydrogenase accessory factor